MKDFFDRLCHDVKIVAQSVDKLIIIKSHTVKYIANTAENIFRTDKPLIFS